MTTRPAPTATDPAAQRRLATILADPRVRSQTPVESPVLRFLPGASDSILTKGGGAVGAGVGYWLAIRGKKNVSRGRALGYGAIGGLLGALAGTVAYVVQGYMRMA